MQKALCIAQQVFLVLQNPGTILSILEHHFLAPDLLANLVDNTLTNVAQDAENCAAASAVLS